MPRSLLAPLALVAACFSPTPPEGLPCSESERCPPGQSCELGICRATPGPGDDAAITDAGGEGDGSRVDGAPAGGLGDHCKADVDCPEGFDCFLDGPGRHSTEGFCTRPCEDPTGGSIDCNTLAPTAVCFKEGSPTGVCALPCFGVPGECPDKLDCADNAGICDVVLTGPMMDAGVSLDSGGPPPPVGDQ